MTTKGLLDRHFSLGSLVNLVVLISAIVAVTAFIRDGQAETGKVETRTTALEQRVAQDRADDKRWQERIEDKIDKLRDEVSHKADHK